MKSIWNRQVLISLAVAAGIVCFCGGTAQAQDGGDSVRPPNIIQNQFTTTTNGSLQARRPGLWIQAGIAATRGSLIPPGVELPIEESFFRETAATVLNSVLDSISGLIDTVSAGISLGFLNNLFANLFGNNPNNMNPPMIPDPTTSGGGTMTPLP